MSDAKPVRSGSGEILVPQQQRTSLSLLRRADTYQQRFLKYAGVAVCHSYSELLHLALCEGDSATESFVPQPFLLRVSGSYYVPDCYVVRKGERLVIELKPSGELDPELKRPLAAFFELNNMRFDVLANELILEREVEALNWLRIVRSLVMARAIDTAMLERTLLEKIWLHSNLCIGDLIDSGDRGANFANEIALFRLLHAGRIAADLKAAPLNYDVELTACD